MSKRGVIAMGLICVVLLCVACQNPASAPTQNPDTYVNRYPGNYNTELSDYSDIRIKDGGGNDISHVVIDLWYAANAIYDVDDYEMFEMDTADTILSDGGPAFNELYNYDAVVTGVFTQNGISQLEKTTIGGPVTFIQKVDGKVYRMAPWKTGYSYGRALIGMQAGSVTADKVTLAVQYREPADGGTQSEATADFTIVYASGVWLVDNYTYPEARTAG